MEIGTGESAVVIDRAVQIRFQFWVAFDLLWIGRESRAHV